MKKAIFAFVSVLALAAIVSVTGCTDDSGAGPIRNTKEASPGQAGTPQSRANQRVTMPAGQQPPPGR